MTIFSDLVPGGFKCGANYLVEFEPSSLWYETSLTIAAQAMKAGVKTHYHTFMHIPREIRQSLEKLGLDPKMLVNEGRFKLIDSYTRLTGLPIQPETDTIAGRPTLSLTTTPHIWKSTPQV